MLDRLCTALIVALACACITPPLVKPAGKPTLELSQRLRELGARCVSADLPSGEQLRGVYVPGPEGGPLVLHFLGSSASVTTGQEFAGLVFDIDELFADFQARGCASLCLDYRGVGASDGECDPRHLREDALAVWNEALQRVRGDARRIIVRGASLGTLAIASLLESGADPAFVVMIAPVRAESVAVNWLREYHGAFAAGFMAPFLKHAVDIELCSAIATRRDKPLIVFGSEGDALLAEDDRHLVRAALEVAGGHWIEVRTRDRGVDHVALVHGGYRVLKNELGLPPYFDVELPSNDGFFSSEPMHLESARMAPCEDPCAPPGEPFLCSGCCTTIDPEATRELWELIRKRHEERIGLEPEGCCVYTMPDASFWAEIAMDRHARENAR